MSSPASSPKEATPASPSKTEATAAESASDAPAKEEARTASAEKERRRDGSVDRSDDRASSSRSRRHSSRERSSRRRSSRSRSRSHSRSRSPRRSSHRSSREKRSPAKDERAEREEAKEREEPVAAAAEGDAAAAEPAAKDDRRDAKSDKYSSSSRSHGGSSSSSRHYSSSHRSSSRRHRDSRSRTRSRSRSRSRPRSRRRSRSRSYERDRYSRSRSRERAKKARNFDANVVASVLGGRSLDATLTQTQAEYAQATRTARRLYIGNLPTTIPLTEHMMLEVFQSTVVALGIATPQPVLTVWLSSGNTFAFCEFRAIQDCSVCATLLQGMAIGGRTLRIGRPSDYKPVAEHLQNFVVGFPPGVGAPPPTFATNIPFMQMLMQGQSPLTNPAMMLLLAQGPQAALALAQPAAAVPGAPAAAAAALPAAAAAPAGALVAPSAALVAPVSNPESVPIGTPSPVLLLENMVRMSDLTHDEDYLDLLADIEEEAERFGALQRVVIPRPVAPADAPASNSAPSTRSGPRVPLGQGTGRIFVHYSDVESAQAAQTKLHGRKFNANTVCATFFPLDKFEAAQYGAQRTDGQYL